MANLGTLTVTINADTKLFMQKMKSVSGIITTTSARINSLQANLGAATAGAASLTKSLPRVAKETSNVGKALKSSGSHITAFKKLSTQFNQLYRTAFNLKTILGVMFAGTLIKGISDTVREIEGLKITLNVITKDGDAAFNTLRAWAEEMPITTNSAINQFVKLRAVGLKPTIKEFENLLNVSYALKGDNSVETQFKVISKALGDVKASGKLRGEEARQLRNAGVNLQEMFAMMGKKVDLSNIAAANISFSEFYEAFQKFSEARFGDLARKQMDTLTGAMNRAKDTFVKMKEIIGASGVTKALKEAYSEFSLILKGADGKIKVDNVNKFIAAGKLLTSVLSGLWYVVKLVGVAFGTLAQSLQDPQSFLYNFVKAVKESMQWLSSFLNQFKSAGTVMTPFTKGLGELAGKAVSVALLSVALGKLWSIISKLRLLGWATVVWGWASALTSYVVQLNLASKATKIFAATQLLLVTVGKKVKAFIKFMTSASLLTSLSALATPWGMVTAAVAVLGVGIFFLTKKYIKLNKEIKESNNTIAKQVTELRKVHGLGNNIILQEFEAKVGIKVDAPDNSVENILKKKKDSLTDDIMSFVESMKNEGKKVSKNLEQIYKNILSPKKGELDSSDNDAFQQVIGHYENLTSKLSLLKKELQDTVAGSVTGNGIEIVSQEQIERLKELTFQLDMVNAKIKTMGEANSFKDITNDMALFAQKMPGVFESMSTSFTSAMTSMGDAFGDWVSAGLQGWAQLRDGLFKQLSAALIKAMIQAVIVKNIMSAIGLGTGGGSPEPTSNTGSNTSWTGTSAPVSGVSVESLPTIAKATGGMITEPVVGKGTKSGRDYLFGENGPEKILSAGESRRSAAGSVPQNSSANVTVNVHNAPEGTQVSSSEGSGGSTNIDIMLDQKISGMLSGNTQTARTLSSTYGMKPKLT